MNMIRYEQAGSVPATTQAAATLPVLIDRAAAALVSAKSSAEVLEARDMARVAYDAAKSAGRLAKAKQAHDTVLSEVYRAQADALMIEARAKMRLAEEYDAAQERGEVASHGGGRNFKVPEGNVETATAADIGLSRKDIHEARQFRDAEAADPGIARRVLDERLSQGQEPTKAALREAVMEAAKQGLRGEGSSSRKNPLYKAPSQAGSAWTHVYGTCRAFAEWATEENLLLALHGLHERTDDQAANIAAVRKAAEALTKFIGDVNAH